MRRTAQPHFHRFRLLPVILAASALAAFGGNPAAPTDLFVDRGEEPDS